jgi:PEGA domain/HEAT repeats
LTNNRPSVDPTATFRYLPGNDTLIEGRVDFLARKEFAMRKITVSAIVLLCGLGQIVVCMAADPPKTGEKRDTLIYVRTDPPGAKVLVDGKELGHTPGLFPVEAGVATIILELKGHEKITKNMTIQANGITRIEIELKPQTPPEQPEQEETDAVKTLLRDATTGNYWSQYKLWAGYQKGADGIPKDPEKAKKWLGELVKDAYLATFRPIKGFAPKTPSEFLANFSEHSALRSESTGLGGASFFRTTNKDGVLFGSFLTAYPNEMRQAIANNPSLKLIAIEKVTPEMFVRHDASPQESLKGVDQVVEEAVTTISHCAEGDSRVEQALKSLRPLDQSEVVKSVVPYLDSSTDTIRRSAIYVLWQGKFADIKPAVPALEKLLGHEEVFTRGMAALALGQNKVPSSYDGLVKMTASDSSGYARRCAAIALGWLGDNRAVPTLKTALKDKDALVTMNAEAALDLLQAGAKAGKTPGNKEEDAGKPAKRRFAVTDKLITKDGVSVDKDAWRIEAKGDRTVRLFEIPNPGMEGCRVIYRAKMKTENLEGRAYLEMWCRMPDGGEYFSKGLQSPVTGTTDWASYETPFFLKKGQRPDLIKLNVVVEGKGALWIKDVELGNAPLEPQGSQTDDARSIAQQPQGTVELVSHTVGVKSFRPGDSITITEVKATSPDLKLGDTVVVKGYYTLVSEPKASLCLFATATKGSGSSPIRPGQTLGINKGEGQFELSETLDCDGYLHVTFYSVPGGKPFGGLYFGTAKQMKDIEHWDVRSWYSDKTPATSDTVVEGVGWRGFRVGATREELIKAFGPMEPSPGSQWSGWVSRYHVDCWFDQAGRASEVRFNKGFDLPLTSGVKIGSPEKDVLAAYGSPDRVVNKPYFKMLEYDKRGVLMWISDGKVFDFTVIKSRDPATLQESFAGTTDERPQGENQRANQQMKARERMRQDSQAFSDQQRSEIESLYQVANQKWQTQQARDVLKTLVEKYKKANRTGCAILYLGQMSQGDEQIAYFKQAIADHSDCFYGDGVQVGAFARFLLGHVYLDSGKPDLAKKLFDEIRKDYPDAVNHSGSSLVAQLPKDESRGDSTETPPAKVAAQTGNILANSGVENGRHAPDAWQQGAPIAGVTYSWDKKVAFKGKASLRIEKAAKRYFPIAQWSQTVDRKGDSPVLEVSAQVKAEKMTKAVLDVLFLDKDGEWISHKWAAYIGSKQPGDPPADHDWKQYSGKVEIPPNTAHICIGLQVYGPGKVWFDDVRASYGTTEPEALAKP